MVLFFVAHGGPERHGSKRRADTVKFQYIVDYLGPLTRAHLCRLMGVAERGLRAWRHRPPVASPAARHGALGPYPRPAPPELGQLRPATNDRGVE